MLNDVDGGLNSFDSVGHDFLGGPLVIHTAGICDAGILAHPGVVLWPQERHRPPYSGLGTITGGSATMPLTLSCWQRGGELGWSSLVLLPVVPGCNSRGIPCFLIGGICNEGRGDIESLPPHLEGVI